MKIKSQIGRIFTGAGRIISTLVLLLLLPPVLKGQSAAPVCTIDLSRPGATVAPVCRGQQLEEFNYQFQGGLYAQLINNPSFEELNDPIMNWTLIKPGSSQGKISSQTSGGTSQINNKQERCIKLEVTSAGPGGVGLSNSGYWGIRLDNHRKYMLSFWAKKGQNFNGIISARLESSTGKVYAQSEDFKPALTWQHFTCDLYTDNIGAISGDNRFTLYASSEGDVYFDVVTLMPPAWKDRPNGLRPDLAAKLDSLKLKYIQFPGGCTAESYKMSECWNWKNSIGPLEERPGSTRSRWLYKNDLYFGLDEYLQLCEDLGAEPVYTCSSGISEGEWDRQWYGVCPTDRMQPIIDDILDLIQYCNGPVQSVWGAQRARNGHPAPYNLKYIEIGNENGWETADLYNPRYAMIHDSILAHYPGMKIMYNGFRQDNVMSHTSGNSVDFVDEHFYLKDLSGLYRKYDTIDPACKKICVAEYASSIGGNGGNITGNFGDALSDAAFMLGCERNSERMWWTGYGNYAGLLGHGNFGPCIVWNDAVTCFASPSYYMQKMLFTDNAGTRTLPVNLDAGGCYCSASVYTQEGKNELILKIVNMNETGRTIKIVLDGSVKVNPRGHSTVLKGAPGDENSIEDPYKIVPVKGTFAADANFKYLFPAHSATVLRIALNNGAK